MSYFLLVRVDIYNFLILFPYYSLTMVHMPLDTYTFVLDPFLSTPSVLSTSHALFSPILNLVLYFTAVATWSHKTR
jgi:hypothetical protein